MLRRKLASLGQLSRHHQTQQQLLLLRVPHTTARGPRVSAPARHARSFAAATPSTPPPLPSIPPPLSGIRVLDLTRVLAGPYCTMLLADLGADVIKVEHPRGGDDTRSWSPPAAPVLPAEQQRIPPGKEAAWKDLPPESAYFLSVNRNKRSITVDLKTDRGREIVTDLARKADVVVENYLPGKLSHMSLGYPELSKVNPALVYASITGYGQTGPYSSAAGYDVIIAADAGLFHITGEPDRPPVKIGVAMTDLTTGLYVHGAIMAALIGRAKTGKGVHIDASLFECQVASLANVASSYLIAGQEASRWGTAHPSIVPYQVFATKDGFIMVGAGNDRQFAFLTELLGRPELASEADFSTNGARVQNRERLLEILQSLFLRRDTREWLDSIGGRIPAAPIRNIRETFEHPQAAARGVTTVVDHPRAGRLTIASPAVRYGEGKMPVHRPPPVLGEHTDEVLAAELGLDGEQIASLRQGGAIGT